jgi:cell wall-associated NlpC family hydrolase
MATHRAPKVTGRAATLGLVGVAAGTVALMPSASQAAAKPTLSQVKAEVANINQQAEVATNTYDAAKEQYTKLQQKLDGLQQEITQEQSSVNTLEATMGLQAAAAYRNGDMSATLELALSASPQTFLDDSGMVSQQSAQESAQLKSIALDQQQLKTDKSEAASLLAGEQQAVTQAASAKSTIVTQLNKVQGILNGLTATQRTQVESTGPAYNGPLPAVSGRAGVAVAYAEARLSKNGPYAYGYGDEGPTYYDCSGLTQMAWAAAGVAIPRTSEEQYAALPHLSSASQLEAGDLIFFFSSEPSHVAIYVGDDMYVQATHSGGPIIMSSLDPSSPYYGNMPVVGYARP